MFASLFTYLQGLAQTYGVWGIFALAFIQEIFPPIPSTLITLSSGIFFFSGQVISRETIKDLFLYVGFPVSSGLTLGSAIIYGIVYRYGKVVIERWGKYMGVAWEDIEKLQKYLRGHIADDFLFFAARCLPIVPSIVLNVFCGVVRWRPLTFIGITFLGTIIRSMWTGFIGWQLGSFYEQYAKVIERIHNLIIVLIVLALGSYIFYKWKKKKQYDSLR